MSVEFKQACARICSHSCRRRWACRSADAAARQLFTCFSMSALSSLATLNLKALLPLGGAAQNAGSDAPKFHFCSEGFQQAFTIAGTYMISQTRPEAAENRNMLVLPYSCAHSCSRCSWRLQLNERVVHMVITWGVAHFTIRRGICVSCCHATRFLVCPCPYLFFWLERVHP
jgi:hypothetical protein